jgi:DNA-binding LytR/AlgR family response regulator
VLAHPENITNMEAEENWINFYFSDRDYLCFPNTLINIITQLPEANFRHWHRSHIINLKEIDYYWYCGRAIELLMSNGQRARISKKYTPVFILVIDDFDNIKWCATEYDVPSALKAGT